MPAVTDLNIGQVACIRPQYGTSGDELPSAEEEEKDLQQRFPNRFHVIRRSSELGDLLQNGQVRILHFAGHADGNPAHLVLEDDKVSPARFHPSYPLLRIGRPLFFLNGCRTGKSWSNAPAFLANSVKVLLTSGCSAIVAPMIKVESPAARKAAKVFYDAVANETIVEAVRQVRCLALDRSTPEEDKATYLSYLVFAPPTLKLKFT
jgi:CHAT domain-containing protein